MGANVSLWTFVSCLWSLSWAFLTLIRPCRSSSFAFFPSLALYLFASYRRLKRLSDTNRRAKVGVNKDSYLVLDKLPAEYDSRVRAMEVEERPQEEYNDVGGLDKQIQDLIEAIGKASNQTTPSRTSSRYIRSLRLLLLLSPRASLSFSSFHHPSLKERQPSLVQIHMYSYRWMYEHTCAYATLSVCMYICTRACSL